MKNVEHAVSEFKKGYSCSQSIFVTYSSQFGLDREDALKISGPFGGGMGRMGETCGAVTGSFMVIGLKYGWITTGDEQKKERVYDLVRKFTTIFTSRNGSIKCQDLLGCDLSTPLGMKTAEEKNLFTTVCPKLVQDAAEIIEQIL